MIDEPAQTISTKLQIPQSDAANRYKAYVLITEGREISKEQAVNELVAIGAKHALPNDLFKQLGLQLAQPAN